MFDHFDDIAKNSKTKMLGKKKGKDTFLIGALL